MSHLLLTAALLLSSQAPSVAPDQTSDTELLLKFIGAVKRGENQGAQKMIKSGAFVGNYEQTKSSTFLEFANYARECQLSEVTVVPNAKGKRMPIGITWRCPLPEWERSASFWFEGESISRIGWGKPLVVKATVSPSP